MFNLSQQNINFIMKSWLKQFKLLFSIGKKIERNLRRRLKKANYVMSGINILPGSKLNPEKQTVLVVSHEASRTGAPVLSLNLVQLLADRYNVVVLLLGSGVIIESFQLAGAEVFLDPRCRWKDLYAEFVVCEICKRHKLLFALVNSVESRRVLPSLAMMSVPTISLLHEFASNTRPRSAFRDAFLWSTETVFSTRLTLDNALAEYPDLNNLSAKVIPQGKCIVPCENISDDQLEVEHQRLSRLIRPGGESDDAIVVLGAGVVQLRKGVDLFIECASRVMRTPRREKCRFVWVGGGYNPEDDVCYSVYLADQVRRAGLEKHIVFIGETSAIEEVYKLADLFLLSSRLDPLPNVAIDAMCHGLPVICFDKTSGIADFLLQNGLGSYCVASYHDTFDLSQKISALVESESLRGKVGNQCKSAAFATFNMQSYVSQLETMAISAMKKLTQEKADVQAILNFGISSKKSTVLNGFHDFSDIATVREYIRRWKTGVLLRKPYPGFHPGIYLECQRLTDNNGVPFADYLRRGQPQGPWNCKVISCSVGKKESSPGSVRVALHLHIYYPELLPELIKRLELNIIRPDLFVSVKDQSSLNQVLKGVSGYKGKVVDVQIVPNRGRDIGPLLTVFGRQLVESYDIVGHLHAKLSLNVADRDLVSTWNDFLLENLLGGQFGGRMADAILASMTSDQGIGIVFPDDPHAIGWTQNRAFAEQVALRLGVTQLPEHFNFPVGTMFWSRVSVLARFVELNLDWEDYPFEPLPYDGSMLHAIERLFGLVSTLNDMHYAVTYVPGMTR